ncbi:MAG: VRR-NUC domain-containing protein [Patescibacteria group bacterium]
MVGKFTLKKPEPTENQVLNAVGEYLELKQIFFFRVNNAPTYQADGRGGGFWRKQSKYSVNGVPDLIAISKQGKFIGLEIKRPTGVQSEDQKKFEYNVRRNGGEYYIIKSVDDIVNIL